MSATRRGLIIFLVMLVVLVACSVISFGVMPSLGIAVGLPVIMVPGEPYDPTLPVDSFRWTNTLTATVLATLITLSVAAIGWWKSKGWKKEVPGRLQSLIELLGGFMYNFSKQMAGSRARLVFPLVGTIFLFLLVANWMKLLPGVESVGVLHCAEEGFSGYPAIQVGDGAYQYWVDQPLNAGTAGSEESYEACSHFKHDPALKPSKDALALAAEELSAHEEAILANEALTQAEIDAELLAVRLEATESVYPEPSYALTSSQLKTGVLPYVFTVTPYVRGASTDLNLTLALAFISVVAIQVFGTIAQGPGYWQKYINIGALGNLQKRPLGVVDFIVGLFEIISEIGKLVSLSFRLFGNMFAGGILLMVMAFLVALVLPSIFVGLEVIITTIQALVFAILTLVFSAQAMEGHHGDEDHESHADDIGELDHTDAAPTPENTSAQRA
jgi:F-type H+-transporting ATPase subunit a